MAVMLDTETISRVKKSLDADWAYYEGQCCLPG